VSTSSCCFFPANVHQDDAEETSKAPPVSARGDENSGHRGRDACQRMWAAPDTAALCHTIVDEAVALIAADGAAVVSCTEPGT